MYNPLETQEPVVLLNFNTSFGKVAENGGVMQAATRQHVQEVEGGSTVSRAGQPASLWEEKGVELDGWNV